MGELNVNNLNSENEIDFIGKLSKLHAIKFPKDDLKIGETKNTKSKDKTGTLKTNFCQIKPTETYQKFQQFDFEKEIKLTLQKSEIEISSNDFKNLIEDFKERIQLINQDIDEKFLKDLKKMISDDYDNLFKDFFAINQIHLEKKNDAYQRKKFYLENYIFNKY